MVWIVWAETALLTNGCLKWLMKNDKNCKLYLGKKEKILIVVGSAACALWIGCFLEHWGGAGQLACGVLAAYLLIASITDLQTCEVYDFLAIVAGSIGLLVLFAGGLSGIRLFSLILFGLIQLFLFMKMYGRADGWAFLVCAVYESRFGKGMLTYLLHMASAFLVLAVIQGLNRNIARNGNLKKPVPFLPYIAVTVWGFL